MHNQERQLTPQEAKIFNKFKGLLTDDVKNDIITADYIISQIEYMFGVEVTEFLVGYRFGVYQDVPDHKEEPTPLSDIGQQISEGGNSPLFAEVNNVMCELQEELCIDPSSECATKLTNAINDIHDSKKEKWINVSIKNNKGLLPEEES